MAGSGGKYQTWTPEQFARRKAAEQVRKKVDPVYMTVEDAQQLPPEALQDPLVRARLKASEPSWPENGLPASNVFTELPEGEGGKVEHHRVAADSVFRGRPVGDGDGDA